MVTSNLRLDYRRKLSVSHCKSRLCDAYEKITKCYHENKTSLYMSTCHFGKIDINARVCTKKTISTKLVSSNSY